MPGLGIWAFGHFGILAHSDLQNGTAALFQKPISGETRSRWSKAAELRPEAGARRHLTLELLGDP